MPVDRDSLSFGIKTSQSNLTYDEILRTWREADEVPVFEHAWLWDHMIPLRGDTNGRARGVDVARRGRREDPTVAPRRHCHQQPASAAGPSRQDGGHCRHLRWRPSDFRNRCRGQRSARSTSHRDGAPPVRGLRDRRRTTREALTALGETCAIGKRFRDDAQPFDFDGQRLRAALGAHTDPAISVGAVARRGDRRTGDCSSRRADRWGSPE